MRLFGVSSCSDNPNVTFFQQLYQSNEIGDSSNRHIPRAPAATSPPRRLVRLLYARNKTPCTPAHLQFSESIPMLRGSSIPSNPMTNGDPKYRFSDQLFEKLVCIRVTSCSNSRNNTLVSCIPQITIQIQPWHLDEQVFAFVEPVRRVPLSSIWTSTQVLLLSPRSADLHEPPPILNSTVDKILRTTLVSCVFIKHSE